MSIENTLHNRPSLILNGVEARKELSKRLMLRVSALKKKPTLAIISIGEHGPSKVYVANKQKFGESLGCRVEVVLLGESVEEKEVIEIIVKLNQNKDIDGIIVQSPVPKLLSFNTLVSYIDTDKDVDGLTHGSPFVPATAKGIISLLDFYKIDFTSKSAVVIGRSRLVGLPTAQAFLDRDVTVTVCHSKTKDLMYYTKHADILVVATGVPGLIDKECVSPGQVVVDVGIHKTENGFVGDVLFDEVFPLVSAITPVPGGVGPMTVFSLFENLVTAVENKISKK